jgi:hypothetical protein
MTCSICGNLLRINATRKKAFPAGDKIRVVLYQDFTCMNDGNKGRSGNPCPNLGKLIDTKETEELVEMG